MANKDYLAAIKAANKAVTDAADSVRFKDGVSIVDGDTLKDEKTGNLQRIQGLDAPELQRFYGTGHEGNKGGTAGGEAAVSVLKTARDLGYTNRVKQGDDYYDRELIDLQNEAGESFTTEAIANEVYDLSIGTSYEDILRRDAMRLFGDKAASETSGDWKIAADLINEAMQEQGQRGKQLRQAATDEQELAAIKDYAKKLGIEPNVLNDVKFRNKDRDINNNAYNPLSVAAVAGLNNAKESLYAVASAWGHSFGAQDLAEWGDDGVARVRGGAANAPKILTDFRDIEDASDFLEFLGTNTVMSLPYMAATMVGAAAAPFTGGASMAVPLSMYMGDIWNEQEADKKDFGSALIGALAMTTIDRFALGQLVKPGAGFKQVFDAAVKKKVAEGMSKDLAKATVNEFSKRQLAGYVADAGNVLKDQVSARNVIKQMLSASSRGMVSESSTEAVQELIGYTAAAIPNGNWDAHVALDRMIQGAVAGGSIGAGFSAAGQIGEAGTWIDARWRAENGTAEQAGNAAVWREEVQKENGYIPSVNEELANARSKAEVNIESDDFFELDNDSTSFAARSILGKDAKKERSFGETIVDTMLSLPQYWRGSTRFIFSDNLLNAAPSLRPIADALGAMHNRVYSGATFEDSKHHTATVIQNVFPKPQALFSAVLGKRVSSDMYSKDWKEGTAKVYEAIDAARDKDGRIDPSRIPNVPGRAAIVKMVNDAKGKGKSLIKDQYKYADKSDADTIVADEDFLLNYKRLDKNAVKNNRSEFAGLIADIEIDGKKIGTVKANELVDQIIRNDAVFDLDSAQDALELGVKPPSRKNATGMLLKNKNAKKFFDNNMYNNVAQAARDYARFQGFQEYIGKDGKVLGAFLNRAVSNNEISEDTANKIAAQLHDYVNADAGTYKQSNSKMAQSLYESKRWLMTAATTTSLHFSALSSLVELAMTLRGGQSIMKALKNAGEELGTGMRRTLERSKDKAGDRWVEREKTAAASRIDDLGYHSTHTGAAATVGAVDHNQFRQMLTDRYFNLIQLQRVTDFTRSLRLSLFADYLIDKLEIATSRPEGEPKTRDQYNAEQELANLGISVNRGDIVKLYNEMRKPEAERNKDYIDGILRTAEFTFVNQAVALPGTANRPLIYKDPRFDLFTHLQGFISTFSANHIPQMWNQYIKTGPPQVKYQTFQMMAMMIALGFASQELKDYFKYFGENPYLDEDKKLRRGIASSGLLGVAERPIEAIWPMYERKTDGVFESVAAFIEGQSPPISKIVGTGSVVKEAANENYSKATNNALKTLGFPVGWRHPVANLFRGDE